MEKMIACCGLICTECNAFLATLNNDAELRKKTAKEWSKMHKAALKPDDIFCDGCLTTTGRIFRYCKVCPIRKCCREKNISNCAYCSDYPCEKITEFFGFVPAAKKVLDEVRQNK
ncbi:MAG: DUF3795 domain-containing protein [Candidatus Cloacimonetes bacterium]|nr:DUF3795 domain-containing protein [Candidatus Cloacimonadota bacterium]